ncbi:MAG TPA: tetratricopeptide repeat protein, partial [Myxococcales bacterium]|nr:tetratricopeptide repeat protein [Myxococcales bacterium]
MSSLAPPTSRNAPCPCGSGKRFKDCHGALAAGAAASEPATLHESASTARRLDEPALLRERARAEWLRGDRAALTTCRRALELAPDDVAAWNLLGEILLQSDPAAAAEAWWRALDLDPGDAEASFHLGNRLRESNEPAAAVIHYERALRRTPGHTAVINNLGLALHESGDPVRAEACYREVLAIDPQHTGALGNLANLLSLREAVREASSIYDRMFAIRRDWPVAIWIRRAMAQNAAQNFVGAIESYREAARLQPDDMQVQLHLGTLYVQQRRYAESDAALQRALELDPGNRYALS